MPPLAIVAGIGAAASIGSAVISSSAAKKSAQTISDSADRSAATNKYIFDTTREDERPWREAGRGALAKLEAMYGLGGQAPDAAEIMRQSPGYQFRVGEGEKAINRAAAARGMWNSGSSLRALSRYNSDYASSEYDKIAGRLSEIAGLGKAATDTTAAAGQSYAGTNANVEMNAANARASAYRDSANATTGVLGDIAGLAGYVYGRSSNKSPWVLN